MAAMDVFCPMCGTKIKCKLSDKTPVSMIYAGLCDECGRYITVENRTPFEQEGTTEIIFH